MSHSYLDIVKKFFLSPHSISYLNVLLRISNDSCSRLIDLKGTGLVLVPLGLVGRVAVACSLTRNQFDSETRKDGFIVTKKAIPGFFFSFSFLSFQTSIQF